MSLIESIMSNFSQDTAYTKLAIHGILEKHLKQSESKSIDDLIEKRTNKNNPSIMGIPQNILVKEFYRDLQNLKQSEKVVECEKCKKHAESVKKYQQKDVYKKYKAEYTKKNRKRLNEYSRELYLKNKLNG